MSDDEEYEYEYDDDEDEMDAEGGNDDEYDDDNQFEYTDEEEEQDDAEVALENAYYNSKGLRETDLVAAAQSFEHVIQLEHEELRKGHQQGDGVGAPGKEHYYGPWSYKAMKQLVKLHLRSGNSGEMMRHYNRLLECISHGDVSPNAIEKGIQGMLERVASLYQQQGSVASSRGGGGGMAGGEGSGRGGLEDPQKLALAVYDATLKVFHPRTGPCKNERLWFKTNLKYGQLLYEMNETSKLQQVLKDLKSIHGSPEDGTDDGDARMHGTSSAGSSGSSTQSMEIYALQIQLYSRQKDHKKLRETFNKAMAVRGGIPHPRTLALIQELGGKMHMVAREYESAGKTFFQAFKSYDEAGDISRLRCLKYLVLASMLHASTINPFDSQEARPYRDDPEIVAMTNLVHAFHNNEIQTFERILRQNQGRIMDDDFVREHVEDLLRTIRTQVLRRVIRPYTRISLGAIARELNDIPVTDVESLLVSLILDGNLDGKIDRVDGVLIKRVERGGASGDASAGAAGGGTASLGRQQQGQGASGGAGAASGGAGAMSKSKNLVVQKCDAMDSMISLLEDLSSQVTTIRFKDGPVMRGMVH